MLKYFLFLTIVYSFSVFATTEQRIVEILPKFEQYIDKQKASASELFAKVASLCTIIQVEQVVSGVCSDTDDEKFLSCALAANVKVLVSGDRHLLDLKQYKSVRIVIAREFYEENICKIT